VREVDAVMKTLITLLIVFAVANACGTVFGILAYGVCVLALKDDL
jgi:phage shock protein PspC (stress-responsive transcriptional regulator)